jgi:dienelactone hydrolase
VVVLLHGYIRPDLYHTLTYTTRYADALARAGYFVLHPNFRNYPPSDEGPNPFRVGYAVDTLNLLALVQKQGAKPGPLEKADPRRIGLFGHSMSGDERRNYEKIMEWSDGQPGASLGRLRTAQVASHCIDG